MKRKFEVLPGFVQVRLEHGEAPDDIVPILSGAAELARAKRMEPLLVISGYGDLATAAAVSRALEQIHATGAPPPFKIAFVACMLPQYSAYHFAEHYAPRFGIKTKVLVSVRDAKEWLAARESVHALQDLSVRG